MEAHRAPMCLVCGGYMKINNEGRSSRVHAHERPRTLPRSIDEELKELKNWIVQKVRDFFRVKRDTTDIIRFRVDYAFDNTAPNRTQKLQLFNGLGTVLQGDEWGFSGEEWRAAYDTLGETLMDDDEPPEGAIPLTIGDSAIIKRRWVNWNRGWEFIALYRSPFIFGALRKFPPAAVAGGGGGGAP